MGPVGGRRDDDAPGRPRRSPSLWLAPAAEVALWSIAVFVLSVIAVRLRLPGIDVAVWWPAAAASVVATLRAPPQLRVTVVAVVAVVSAAANVFGGQDLWVSAAFGLVNGTEAAVVVAVMTAGGNRARLDTVADAIRLVIAGAIGALVAGLGAALTVSLGLEGEFARTMLSVGASHLSAVVLLVALVLPIRHLRPAASLSEAVLQNAVLVATVALVFRVGGSEPLTFLTLLPLVWGALRLTPRLSAGQVLLSGALVTTLTVFGGGPFAASAGDDPTVAVWMIQFFVLMTWVVTMTLSLASAEQRDALERLTASERLFRGGFSDAVTGMVLLTPRVDGELEITNLNQTASRVLGVSTSAVLGLPLSALLTPESSARVTEGAARVLEDAGSGWHQELRLLPSGGEDRWVELAMSQVEGIAGEHRVITAQIHDISEQRDLAERMKQLALHDDLTGLANRVQLRDRLFGALQDPTSPGSPGVGLMFVDLDSFKRINDDHGHAVGDGVLVEVARRLTAAVRERDLVARIGGDEFVILCPDLDLAALQTVVGRVSRVFDEEVTVDGVGYRVGASVGVVTGEYGSHADEMLRRADEAMYAAKVSGTRVTYG